MRSGAGSALPGCWGVHRRSAVQGEGVASVLVSSLSRCWCLTDSVAGTPRKARLPWVGFSARRARGFLGIPVSGSNGAGRSGASSALSPRPDPGQLRGARGEAPCAPGCTHRGARGDRCISMGCHGARSLRPPPVQPLFCAVHRALLHRRSRAAATTVAEPSLRVCTDRKESISDLALLG